MTREETLGIMGVLKAAYPAYYKDLNRRDAEQVVDLWSTMFVDDPVEVVAAAVKRHIATDTKGFPPHIGAIKASIGAMKKPEELTELEAWELVRKSLRNASVAPQSVGPDGKTSARRSFEQLPDIVQRIVGSPEQLADWAGMDTETINSVVASNFQRSYKARAAKDREFLALPADVRETMELLADGFRMPGLTDGRNEG